MKEQFLKDLEKKLYLLEEKERKKVIKQYEKMIDDKISEGKNEKEAISEIGQVVDVAIKILKSYKIDPKYYESKRSSEETTTNDKDEKSFSNFINSIIDSVDKFLSNISEKESKYIIRIIFYVLLALFGIWLIRIPFFIIEKIGVYTFDYFDSPIDTIFIGIWMFMVNIIYLLIIIKIIFVIYKRFNYKNTIKKTDIKAEPKVEEKEVKDNINVEKVGTMFSSIFLLLLRMMIIIFTLPMFFVLIGLFIAIGFLINLWSEGVYVLGPILIILGLISLTWTLIRWIYHIAFDKRRWY